MKTQEAIENLKYLISGDCTDTQTDFVEEIEMAINALEKQKPKDNFCPLMVSGGNMHVNGRCIGEDCAWFCEFAGSCSIPLLAGMFADSEICRNVFEKDGEQA